MTDRERWTLLTCRSHSTRWGAGFLLVLAALSLWPALEAGAVPRYSARYAQSLDK